MIVFFFCTLNNVDTSDYMLAENIHLCFTNVELEIIISENCLFENRMETFFVAKLYLIVDLSGQAIY